MKQLFKRVLYPGINLHARERFHRIPEQFGAEVSAGRRVLDAGCGNGMLCWRAWQRGAIVLGISIKQNEVDGCRQLFNGHHGIRDSELRFDNINLYELDTATHQFDAIICTEVLEHIVEHDKVCAKFFQLLKPGGVLHATSPNAEHPYNKSFPLDQREQGGHVRAGYTEDSFRALLEPIGFRVERVSGLGGPVRQTFDSCIIRAQERFGAYAGLPVFLAALPFLLFDGRHPRVPFCLYVKATKPAS